MKKFASYLAVGLLCSATTLGGYHLLGYGSSPSVAAPDATVAPVSQPLQMVSNVRYGTGPGTTPVDFTYAAEKSNSAVVHIRSSVVQQPRAQRIPDPFRQFFGDDFFGSPRGPQRGESSGSGVIIRQDGFIVTNNHVVENAEKIEVTLYDRRVFEAKVVGTDPSTDLAILQVSERNLPTLAFANSDEVKIGEWVLAVGNPFNLESTVTAGIVSAKGRNINILNRADNQYAIESFIQTDAAVNPGNSGGALVNLNGDLIGINTAIATPTGTYAGYAFAVPSGIVAKVAEDLIEFGVVQRGLLGVSIRDVNGRSREDLNVNRNSGVYVDSVFAKGAAAEADLRHGDIIIAVDGNPVATTSDLQEKIGRKRPGERVALTIDRGGKERQMNVTLKNREGTTTAVSAPAPSSAVLEQLGLAVEPLSKEEMAQARVESGVKVTRILEGKIRNETDMRPGYVITRVDGRPVRTEKELSDLLGKKQGGVMLEGFYPGRSGKFYYAFGM